MMGRARSSGDERLDPFYAAVRAVGRFWVWFLFKGVEARDRSRVPAGGPVLLCINHPNNLVDSLLVGAVLPRKVHYLATAALFRNPLVSRFLLACGAIPVYRKQDDPGKMDRNLEAFSACVRTLERGQVVGIYPEGTTHAEPRVQRIRTGAARIALEYEARRQSAGESARELSLIPVGLSFEARKSFRGRVLVAFGEAVPVAPGLAQYREDPVKAVDGLTTAIQGAMEAQVVHVDRIHRADLVRAVEELYRSDLVRELEEGRGLSPGQIDPFRLSRAIAEAVAHFERLDPARVERLWLRIQAYRALLAAYRQRDQAVRERLGPPGNLRDHLRRSWQAPLGLPVFLYGAAVNGLPYLLPRWLSRRLARKDTDYATIRLLTSVVAFPLFWGLETWAVWRVGGAAWATAFALSLPVSGLLAYRYLGGLGRLRRQLGFALLGLTRDRAGSRLLAERRWILAELDRARAEYLAGRGDGA